MANFSYADYQSIIANAQNSANRVGFFKLANDGDEALVRINAGSIDDLNFVSVHTIQAGGKWMKVSCLNPLGSYSDTCALCAQNAAGNKSISRAAKRVYLQMLCAYKDAATGNWSTAIPVVWERPASFSRDVANFLRDYGDLREVVLKITRNGAAGDMKTTYSINFIPTFNSVELVPKDFSAFANFKIEKHSYYEKTAAEIDTFIRTGSFPEATKVDTTPNVSQGIATQVPNFSAPQQPVFGQPTPAIVTPIPQQSYPQQAYPQQTIPYSQPNSQQPTPTVVTPTPVEIPVTKEQPGVIPSTRTFGGYSF